MGKEGNHRVLVLYQEEWGSVDPWRRAVRFQGIPGGVIWGPSSIPGQRGGLRIPGQIKILFIPGHFQDSVYTRLLSRFCLYQVTSKILFIPGRFQDSVYTRWCSFTHTSVRGAASAWTADTRCRAIATAFERLPS